MHLMISEPSNSGGNGRGRQKRIAALALVGILVSSIVIAALLLFHPGRHTLHRPGPGNSTLISPSFPGDGSDPGKGSTAPPGRSVEESPPSQSSPADTGGEGGLSG